MIIRCQVRSFMVESVGISIYYVKVMLRKLYHVTARRNAAPAGEWHYPTHSAIL